MDFEQLCYFKKVAQLEHITKAAEELFISQSSLSLSIQKLENEFGVQLFERKGRNICLNEYGKIMLNHCDTLMNDYKRLKEDIDKQYTLQYNSLTIVSFTLLRYPDLFHNIISKYPEITINYVDYDYDQLQKAVENGEIDFCILPYELAPPVNSTTLLNSRVAVLASKKHPLARKNKVGINDLNNYSFVIYHDGFPIRPFQDQIFSKMNLRARFYPISKGMMDSVMAVSTGKYLTIIPEEIIEEINDEDEFVLLPIDLPVQYWNEYLLSYDFPNKSALAKDVEKIIIDYFSNTDSERTVQKKTINK